MALIRHTFFPRSMFDMDYWFRPLEHGIGPSTLELFDPFDQLDRSMSRNLQWLTVPEFLRVVLPSVNERHRITTDCTGFSPESIKTEIKEDSNTLVVSAREGNSSDKKDEDYSVREFRKSYKLPENVDTKKMVSFVTSSGQLVVEIPYKEDKMKEKARLGGDQFPRIVESNDGSGSKSVQMDLSLPSNIDPTKLTVTCKDRDVIIRGNERVEKPDGVSQQVSYYRRTTLPDNTDFSNLKCTFDNNMLSVSAPLLKDFSAAKTVPIEFKNSNQKITNEQKAA